MSAADPCYCMVNGRRSLNGLPSQPPHHGTRCCAMLIDGQFVPLGPERCLHCAPLEVAMRQGGEVPCRRCEASP